MRFLESLRKPIQNTSEKRNISYETFKLLPNNDWGILSLKFEKIRLPRNIDKNITLFYEELQHHKTNPILIDNTQYSIINHQPINNDHLIIADYEYYLDGISQLLFGQRNIFKEAKEKSHQQNVSDVIVTLYQQLNIFESIIRSMSPSDSLIIESTQTHQKIRLTNCGHQKIDSINPNNSPVLLIDKL